MKVLIVSIFSKALTYGKGRAGNLMKFLPADASYTLLASDFDHRNKKYYDIDSPNVVLDNGVNVNYIHVPEYSKNLSFSRIWGNIKFGLGVKNYLKKTPEIFDLIYCIVPSASGVLGCRNYLKNNHTKLVVDVMDLLPESLLPIIGDNWMTRLILSPWFMVSKKAYRTAHFVTGESKEYANVAHKQNPTVPYTYTYLGIDLAQVDVMINNREQTLLDDGTIKICYGGNLGNSYDFNAIFNALVELKNKGVKYSVFFVGGGDKEDAVREKIKETGVNATVTGIVPYKTYIEYMSQCDIGLNVFKKSTKIVHSYKFNDYAACGLYIVSNLHGETEEMLHQYDCGVTNDNIIDALCEVCLSWDSIKQKKNNSRKMAEEELNADVIYKKQTDKILSIL